VLVALLAGCSSSNAPPPSATTPTPATSSTPPPTAPSPTAPPHGVAFTPAGNDVAGFFAEAPQLGSVVLWGGPAEQLNADGAAPAVVATLAAQKRMQVAIQTDFVWPNATFDANASTATAAAFARRYHPAYFALAVEADRLHDADPAAFDRLAAWYPSAYAAVKNASPETKVFVTWQFEHVDGRDGGLYGGADAGPQHWDLLSKVAPLDLAAFTTYPGLVLHDAAALPSGYYADLARAPAPVAFTEVGAFADSPAPGWTSNATAQAAFVRAFFAATASADPKLVVWFEVHDQPQASPAPFRHMGLVDESGAKRPAWDAWVAATGG